MYRLISCLSLSLESHLIPAYCSISSNPDREEYIIILKKNIDI